MFVLTNGVLPAAAKSERLLLLMATTPRSKVIRDLQPLRSSVMQRGCKLGSAPCVTFRFFFFQQAVFALKVLAALTGLSAEGRVNTEA